MSVTTELERSTFKVRERCGLELALRSTEHLRHSDTVEVQFPHSWMLVTGPSYTRQLQADDPTGEHYISVESEPAKFEIEIRRRTLHCPEGIVRHGRHIIATIVDGEIPAGQAVHIRYLNTFAPYVSETETIWLRAKDESPDPLPTVSVTPGEAETLRVIAPSCVEPGKQFEVLIVSLDEFDNCSSTSYEDEVLSVNDGPVLNGGLTFTGSARVEVKLKDAGVHRLKFRDVLSNPIRVEKKVRPIYWGDIHIHTKISHDGQGNDPYGYARHVSGLDFAATADHCQSTGPLGYAQQLDWARAANAPGKFAAILGDERNPGDFSTDEIRNRGHYNVYFRDVEAFLKYAARPVDAAFVNMLAAGAPQIDPGEAMFVPHHTGIAWGTEGPKGAVIHANDRLAGMNLRPVIEIYSHHGQSEYYAPQHVLSYEFNRMRNPERRTNTSCPGPYYAQDYWMAGKRMGVIASSDEHSGQGGRRHGGITAVWAEELTSPAIFDAIRNRKCYATTGERILLDFTVAGLTMGQAGKHPNGQPLKINLRIWGTELLLRVEILRYVFGERSFETILSHAPRPESMDAAYELEDDFARPCMYYARVTQEPLESAGMGWTSPVWLDLEQ